MSDIEKLLTKRILECCKSITNIPKLNECFISSSNIEYNYNFDTRNTLFTTIGEDEIDNIKNGYDFNENKFVYNNSYYSLDYKIRESIYDVIKNVNSTIWETIYNCQDIVKNESEYSVDDMTLSNFLYLFQNARLKILENTHNRFRPNSIILSSYIAFKIKREMAINGYVNYYDNNILRLYDFSFIEDYSLDQCNLSKILVCTSDDFINLIFECPNDKKNIVYINNIPIIIVYKYDINKQIYAFGFETKFKIDFKRPENAVLITLKE